jgi:hypothetical protein
MNTNESERLIPPAPEPAHKHWLLLATHRLYMSQVERDFPEWHDDYEDASSLVFDVETAFRLAETAPSEYTAGLLIGRALLLEELRAMTKSTTPESV